MDALSGLFDRGRLAVCDVRVALAAQSRLSSAVLLLGGASALRGHLLQFIPESQRCGRDLQNWILRRKRALACALPHLGAESIERLSIRVDTARNIFLFSYPRFRREMKMSVERLRLPRMVPYQTRLSEASWSLVRRDTQEPLRTG